MTAKYKIHPAIGIARLGNSQEFYLSPEKTGALPIQCNPDGTVTGGETPVVQFKDSKGAIKRQAARFRIYVYDDQSPAGRELEIGETIQVVRSKSGQTYTGAVADIVWTAYLANKKASWYLFDETNGEHGYKPNHPVRNPTLTNADERQKLIIDPGPRTVSTTGQNGPTNAHFSPRPGTPQSFPPPLTPNSITTLGSILATQQGKFSRLVLLGAFGNSGSIESGLGKPVIKAFANNDGWFDDISDGPVKATILLNVTHIDGNPVPAGAGGLQQVSVPVDSPAWAIVGYPRYAPEIVDIVTMDDLLYDLSLRYFAFNPFMFGVAPYTCAAPEPEDLGMWRTEAKWNANYLPYFKRDIWPILVRPNNYQWVMDADAFGGGDPHNSARGTGRAMDPDIIGIPPFEGENPDERESRRNQRQFIYGVLRKPGEENRLTVGSDPYSKPYTMPLLCGDNPITNTSPSKFLRLTDTQLFILKQWAAGKFINEDIENLPESSILPVQPGVDLDRGALGAVLGGAFCPGAEACWIMRNPAIYSEAYRVHHASYTPGGLSQPAVVAGASASANLANGLEPGDITKYDALPWQADFNECSTQTMDVTYEGWNQILPDSTGDPVKPVPITIYWWPAHRPMNVNTLASPSQPNQNPPVAPSFSAGQWSPTPQNHSGDLQMVAAWAELGFILRNPWATPGNEQTQPKFVNVPDGNAQQITR